MVIKKVRESSGKSEWCGIIQFLTEKGKKGEPGLNSRPRSCGG